VYSLTDLGRQEQHNWSREPVEEPPHDYPHLMAALSLIASLPSGEVLVLLRRRIARLVDQRAQIRALVDAALDDGVPPLPRRRGLPARDLECRAWIVEQIDRADRGPGVHLAPDVARPAPHPPHAMAPCDTFRG
jgi:hypothetical protein